jgi:hypothetical protein
MIDSPGLLRQSSILSPNDTTLSLLLWTMMERLGFLTDLTVPHRFQAGAKRIRGVWPLSMFIATAALLDRHSQPLGGKVLSGALDFLLNPRTYLKRRFGQLFVPHGHLHSLINLNKVGGRDYLDPVAAAAAWERGEWETVARSREAKVGAIDCLYRLFWQGRLQTSLGAVGLSEATRGPVAGADPKKARRRMPRPDPKTVARDKWLAQQRDKGRTYEQIKFALNGIAVQKGWDDICSVQGIQQAIDRHNERCEAKKTGAQPSM